MCRERAKELGNLIKKKIFLSSHKPVRQVTVFHMILYRGLYKAKCNVHAKNIDSMRDMCVCGEWWLKEYGCEVWIWEGSRRMRRLRAPNVLACVCLATPLMGVKPYQWNWKKNVLWEPETKKSFTYNPFTCSINISALVWLVLWMSTFTFIFPSIKHSDFNWDARVWFGLVIRSTYKDTGLGLYWFLYLLWNLYRDQKTHALFWFDLFCFNLFGFALFIKSWYEKRLFVLKIGKLKWCDTPILKGFDDWLK